MEVGDAVLGGGREESLADSGLGVTAANSGPSTESIRSAATLAGPWESLPSGFAMVKDFTASSGEPFGDTLDSVNWLGGEEDNGRDFPEKAEAGS